MLLWHLAIATSFSFLMVNLSVSPYIFTNVYRFGCNSDISLSIVVNNVIYCVIPTIAGDMLKLLQLLHIYCGAELEHLQYLQARFDSTLLIRPDLSDCASSTV